MFADHKDHKWLLFEVKNEISSNIIAAVNYPSYHW